MEESFNCKKQDEIFDNLIKDIELCDTLESLLCDKQVSDSETKMIQVDSCILNMKERLKYYSTSRKKRQLEENTDVSDMFLSKHARFMDFMALKPFESFLEYVPRLVNVVTV